MSHRRPADGGAPTIDDIKASIEKRLFLGRLQGTCNEAEMREVFGQFGQLKECRVVANKGVGFVAFNTWASAHRAMVECDGQPCLPSCAGSPIVASFAERTQTGGRRGGGSAFSKGMDLTRVFVGGLPEHLTDPELRALFEPFGAVEGANLLPPKGRSRCGFVNYHLWGEALDAIENLDGQMYPGGSEAMQVLLAAPKEGDGEPAAKYRRTGVAMFGSGLEAQATRFDIQPVGANPSIFEGLHQPVAHIGVNIGAQHHEELETLKAAYMAAIDGETPETICNELHRKIMATRLLRRMGNEYAAQQAQQAQQLQNHSMFAGVQTAPLHSQSMEDRDAARLFVGGLPYECSDEELRALADQVTFPTLAPEMCQIIECRVLPNRGCGYLKYTSWEAAQEAIQALNDRAVSGWQLPLRVRWATPKAGDGRALSPCSASGAPGAHQQALADDLATLNALGGAAGLQALLNADAGNYVQQLASGQQQAGLNSMPPSNFSPSGTYEETSVLSQGLDPRRLFVGQLTRDLRDKVTLQAIFEPFGRIESLRWLEDKGVAYVQFAEFSGAAAAVATLNEKHIPGVSREMGLNVNFSKVR